MNMSKCPKCRTAVEAGDEFCPECGARVKQEPPRNIVEKLKERVGVEEQQPKPKSHKVFWTIAVIIIIIILFRACSSFSASEPQIAPSREYIREMPAQEERIVSIDTPAPRTSPIPEPRKPDKSTECSGVSARVIDACFSCGLVSCGLLVSVENTGSKPIIGFKTKAYRDAMNSDDSNSFEPVDKGATKQFSVYTSDTNIRMAELFPKIVVNGEEILCDNKAIKYGNAYGSPFGECIHMGY